MLLGFKDRFAQFVKEGSKTHTIRARRKTPPKIGETCHCYTGLRQKGARLLGRFPCVKVEEIRILRNVGQGPDHIPLMIQIGNRWLDKTEMEVFLFRDGFRDSFFHPTGEIERRHPSIYGAAKYWEKTLEEEPFEGVVIHWKF